jgi:TATA-binding protein-associated factor
LTQRQINEVFQNVDDPQNYKHSGKMVALEDILKQLGFGDLEDSE